MTTLVYESGTAFLKKIFELGPDHVRILCPVCRSDVQFAPDFQTASKLKMHPGLRCSKDQKHLIAMFELNPPKA
jgi:hypothetical protein